MEKRDIESRFVILWGHKGGWQACNGGEKLTASWCGLRLPNRESTSSLQEPESFGLDPTPANKEMGGALPRVPNPFRTSMSEAELPPLP